MNESILQSSKDDFDNRLQELIHDSDKAQKLISLRHQLMMGMTELRDKNSQSSSASVAYEALKMIQDFFNSYSQMLTDEEYQSIFELSKSDTQKALNAMPDKIAHNTIH
jgi:hypothetical protein